MFLFLSNFLRLMSVGSALLMTSSVTHAFVSPNAFNTRVQNQAIDSLKDSTRSSALLKMVPFDSTAAESTATAAASLLLSDEAQIVSVANASLDFLKNTVLIAVGFLVGGGVFTYVVANFVVPKAAEQLETDTKRLRPDLWAEYEAKLQPGETMITRPDLLQELGNVMQPIIMGEYDAKFDADAQAEADTGSSVSETVDAEIVDAEIVDKSRSGKPDERKSSGWGGNQWDD